MLKPNELLDRMEILYPVNDLLSVLRRAYIDKDLSSIFKLLDNYCLQDVDDLRKLTMEQNLHVLFRLFDGDIKFDMEHCDSKFLEPGDLRKVILEDNEWSLYRVLLDMQDTQLIHAIKSLHASETGWDTDAMSRGQLMSKVWLVNELTKLDVDLGTVFLCAGWYGILAVLLFESDIKLDKIRSFDVDPSVIAIAEKFNLPWFSDTWKFKALTEDIHKVSFVRHEWQAWSAKNNRMSYPIEDIPDTIINTSCEHIENFDEWYEKIPDGKLVVLQSNNFQEVGEHINISIDYNNFADQTPMAEVMFGGELELPTYKRFMRIGRR